MEYYFPKTQEKNSKLKEKLNVTEDLSSSTQVMLKKACYKPG